MDEQQGYVRCSRFDKRRQAARKIFATDDRNKIRGPICEAMLGDLLYFLEKNSHGQFGIVKLGVLDVDQSFLPPIRYASLFPFKRTNLLELAAWRGRDSVVAALLYSGADPSRYPRTHEAIVIGLRESLSRLPPPYQVWIVRQVVSMRIAGLEFEGAQQRYSCHHDVNVIRWSGTCGHLVCESCAWLKFLDVKDGDPDVCTNINSNDYCSPAVASYWQLRCPLCSCFAFDGDEEPQSDQDDFHDKDVARRRDEIKMSALVRYHALPSSAAASKSNRPREEILPSSGADSISTSFLTQAPKSTSMSIQQMPSEQKEAEAHSIVADQDSSSCVAATRSGDERGSDNGRLCLAKGRFRALSATEVAFLLPGSFRGARSEALFRAAAAGDATRIRALVALGVDLEAVNEYGQTALFLTVLFNRPHALKVLLRRGADHAHRSHGGATPASVARARNSSSISSILAAHSSGIGSAQQRIHAESTTVAVSASEAAVAINSEEEKQWEIDSHVVDEKRFELDESRAPKECDDGEHHRIPPILESLPQPAAAINVVELVPGDSKHPGAGALFVDGGFPEAVLARLDATWRRLPDAPPEKASCSSRRYFCDAEGWIGRAISRVLLSAKASLRCRHVHLHSDSRQQHENVDMGGDISGADGCGGGSGSGSGGGGNRSGGVDNTLFNVDFPREAFPHMRFVCYVESGGRLAPHIDLAHRHPFSPERRSTHTFILYLTDCASGGETALLNELPGTVLGATKAATALATVAPMRGRLLIFPHACPHEGCPVEVVPKLFLRGELY